MRRVYAILALAASFLAVSCRDDDGGVSDTDRIGTPVCPDPSRPDLIAWTWPSIMPLGATTWAPASACATAIEA
jgi:hypothetical protein